MLRGISSEQPESLKRVAGFGIRRVQCQCLAITLSSGAARTSSHLDVSEGYTERGVVGERTGSQVQESNCSRRQGWDLKHPLRGCREQFCIRPTGEETVQRVAVFATDQTLDRKRVARTYPLKGGRKTHGLCGYCDDTSSRVPLKDELTPAESLQLERVATDRHEDSRRSPEGRCRREFPLTHGDGQDAICIRAWRREAADVRLGTVTRRVAARGSLRCLC